MAANWKSFFFKFSRLFFSCVVLTVLVFALWTNQRSTCLSPKCWF